ncbi:MULTISPECIES: SusC/RagA family TonB-linked outer membrane protein [Flavobacteriaceae]|uniref:SusC/RagA family TonB-linked outer membrane protein n=1 Tax=Flavobacteriaceae TaxID=49546 RepID=UPI0014925429|nr:MULTISPECIES: TonB-dependent receptor [Allomuricauda]MDC6367615.1 TonB-dependent receptor [Muricauda sp. AC10]
MKTTIDGKPRQAIFKLYICILLFNISLSAQANNFLDTEISIEVYEQTVDRILKEIENETSFSFRYADDIMQDQRKFSIAYKNTLLKTILNDLSEKAGLEYKISGNYISVKRSQEKWKLKGSVIDKQNTPIPGANVSIKNSAVGTISDFDGKFELEVSPGDILVFSYIGFTTQEVSITNQQELTVSLNENVDQLQEVIVYGYGTGTKEKFNGAVSKVDSEKLNNFSSANFEQALAGNVAGVQVVGNGKNPGENSVIQIRGLNTLTAGTNPLIVVDGNPLTEGSSFSSISNQDIASINILKDAASAAIYGSRASNGVILITTKKGKQGDLKVTYDTYYGFQNRIDNFELADAYDTALFDLDARNFGYISGGTGRSIADDNATRDANGGGKRSRVQPFLQDYVNGQTGLTNTDWTDAVFRTAHQQNHYINLSGGTEKTDYSVSFGYLDQENIIISSDYKRYTTNLQLNTQISDRVRFGITSNISLVNSNPTGKRGWSSHDARTNNQPDPAYAVVLMHPYYPIYNADGSFAIANQIDDNNDNWDGPISENVVAKAELTNFFERRLRVFGNTYLEADIYDGLRFKTSFGGDYNTIFSEFFAPSNIGNYRTPVANNLAVAFENNNRRENYITENLLTYNKTFGKHTIDALFGFSYQQESRFNTRLESNNFADDNLRNIAGATNPSSQVQRRKWALTSYFSRLQYDYDGKYSISGSLRRDGSSRFGANTKFGNFASLSGGWVLSNEAFFPDNKLVSFAKLRASWGQTGNNQIGDFAAIALVEPDNYVIDNQLVSGSYTSTSPNPNLSWETNTALNLGVDLGFLDNKLFLTAEYYNSKTTDLLLDVPVPQQSGFEESLQNIGELENRGFEFELRGSNFQVGELNIGFNANLTTNKNEILALGDGQEQIIDSRGGMGFLTKVGGSIAEFYAYDIIGVYRSQAQLDAETITPLSGTEVGDYVVRDVDGDGEITPDDRTTLGQYNPKFTYGFGISLNYKGFDLNAQFNGIEGRKVTDNMLYDAESGEGFFVPTKYYVDNYFNDRNPDGFFRRPDFSSFSSAGRLTRASSLSVYDADYFRLRSIQLGYNFQSNITDYLGVDALRLYMTGNNIFNITNYRGYNSDGITATSNEAQTLTRGFINSTSPLTRFVALGLNVKF